MPTVIIVTLKMPMTTMPITANLPWLKLKLPRRS